MLEPLQRFRPCQPALADRPPSGPGWLHEIKFEGYRVIARRDGEQVRLWARTTSDYSKAFTRIRDAVAALPVDVAVLDGEAIVLRPDAAAPSCSIGEFESPPSRVTLSRGRAWLKAPISWPADQVGACPQA